MGGDAPLKREIADNLNQNKACNLSNLIGDMSPQEQIKVLKEATELANRSSGKDNFSVKVTSGKDGIWWGDFVEVSVQKNRFLPAFSYDIFTTKHGLDPNQLKRQNSCTEKY